MEIDTNTYVYKYTHMVFSDWDKAEDICSLFWRGVLTTLMLPILVTMGLAITMSLIEPIFQLFMGDYLFGYTLLIVGSAIYITITLLSIIYLWYILVTPKQYTIIPPIVKEAYKAHKGKYCFKLTYK